MAFSEDRSEHSVAFVALRRRLFLILLDRVLHHPTIVNINGESFRLKDKRKAGLLGKSAKH